MNDIINNIPIVNSAILMGIFWRMITIERKLSAVIQKIGGIKNGS